MSKHSSTMSPTWSSQRKKVDENPFQQNYSRNSLARFVVNIWNQVQCLISNSDSDSDSNSDADSVSPNNFLILYTKKKDAFKKMMLNLLQIVIKLDDLYLNQNHLGYYHHISQNLVNICFSFIMFESDITNQIEKYLDALPLTMKLISDYCDLLRKLETEHKKELKKLELNSSIIAKSEKKIRLMMAEKNLLANTLANINNDTTIDLDHVKLVTKIVIIDKLLTEEQKILEEHRTIETNSNTKIIQWCSEINQEKNNIIKQYEMLTTILDFSYRVLDTYDPSIDQNLCSFKSFRHKQFGKNIVSKGGGPSKNEVFDSDQPTKRSRVSYKLDNSP